MEVCKRHQEKEAERINVLLNTGIIYVQKYGNSEIKPLYSINDNTQFDKRRKKIAKQTISRQSEMNFPEIKINPPRLSEVQKVLQIELQQFQNSLQKVIPSFMK
jgi:hypothetical protein